jgi:hypothetical protein
MTAAQTLAMKPRRSSGDEDAGAGTGPSPEQQDPWEQAPAPAKVARKILEGVFDCEVPPKKIGLLTNAVHWGYGTSWGALYGLLPGTARVSPVRRGLMFGTAVWVMSYLTLVPMGIYRAPWRYPPGELALDLSYHLAYGAGVGAGFALIDGVSRARP